MTIANDGSVSGSPCHDCNGLLVLRRSPTGGFFLGCNNYSKESCHSCTFTMEPNTDEVQRVREAQAEKRAARQRKRIEKLLRKKFLRRNKPQTVRVSLDGEIGYAWVLNQTFNEIRFNLPNLKGFKPVEEVINWKIEDRLQFS